MCLFLHMRKFALLKSYLLKQGIYWNILCGVHNGGPTGHNDGIHYIGMLSWIQFGVLARYTKSQPLSNVQPGFKVDDDICVIEVHYEHHDGCFKSPYHP